MINNLSGKILFEAVVGVAAHDENDSSIEAYHIVKYLNSSSYDYNFATYLHVRDFFTWLSLCVALIGLVGNILSFIVLINPKMRTTTNIFLANLCISSFIALICLLINSIFYEISFYYGPDICFEAILFAYRFVYPVANTFQLIHISLTVAVSVNQFLCIYFSRARNYSKMSAKAEHMKTVKVVVVIYIMCVIYCIPYWLKFKYDQHDGLQKTVLGKNRYFNQIVHFWLYLPIVYIIPFSILIFTNAYLLAKLLLAKRKRKSLGLLATINNVNGTISDFNSAAGHNNEHGASNRRESAMKSGGPRKVSLNVRKQSSRRKSSRRQQNRPENNNNHANQIERFDLASLSSNNSLNNFKFNSAGVLPSKKSIQSRTSTKLGRTKITAMLVVVVFFFFICQV
jgi:hypothetical protein